MKRSILNQTYMHKKLVYLTEAQALLHLLAKTSALSGLHANKLFRDFLFLKGKYAKPFLTK